MCRDRQVSRQMPSACDCLAALAAALEVASEEDVDIAWSVNAGEAAANGSSCGNEYVSWAQQACEDAQVTLRNHVMQVHIFS